jgi:hypothetical protein
MQDPLIDICDKKSINTSHCKVFEIDIYTCTVADLDFAAQYELTCFRNDTFSGLISWFDIYFDKLPNKVYFTTSPYEKSTHWKQVIFYSENDFRIEKGDVIKGAIATRKSHDNFRALDVKVSYHTNGRNGKRDLVQQYKIR